MRLPEKAPTFHHALCELSSEGQGKALLSQAKDDYLHWDELKHRTPPDGLTRMEWWLSVKYRRMAAKRHVPLKDKQNQDFTFSVPNRIAKQLHEIDLGAGGRIGIPEPVTNPETRDQYLIRSLMEEAITSSQLEGAVTTREVATEMLRSGRKPKDKSEKMILNNYRTMRRIREIKDLPLSPELVFEIHRLVTEGTLEKPDAAGRLRREDELVTIEDDEGEIMHLPPPAQELEQRLKAMCDFANAETEEPFIHPAIRAMSLHFWLAYDHPFLDGNGRTARALFYWAMLHTDYWLFEYISISDVLKRAPVKYYRAFLHTESDENDLTYFLLHQSEVIRKAIDSLHNYIARKTLETRENQILLRDMRHTNHRQQALLGHALRHPGTVYTIEGHLNSNGISYNTARTDLLGLWEQELFIKGKKGNKMVFHATTNLEETIRKLSS
jgi:Fic family protein